MGTSQPPPHPPHLWRGTLFPQGRGIGLASAEYRTECIADIHWRHDAQDAACAAAEHAVVDPIIQAIEDFATENDW